MGSCSIGIAPYYRSYGVYYTSHLISSQFRKPFAVWKTNVTTSQKLHVPSQSQRRTCCVKIIKTIRQYGWYLQIARIVAIVYSQNHCNRFLFGVVTDLRIHWRLLVILNTGKKVYEVMFLNMQKYVYSETLFNTLYIEIKHKC